jgi:PAS domain S-box-containing protein
MADSLRVRLPLLLFAFVVGAACLTLLVALPLQNRAIEMRGVEQARNQIDLVQSGLNTILRHGDLADARTYLGSIMLDAAITRVLLLDSGGRVLVDPHRELEHELAPGVLGPDLVAVLDRVVATRSGEVRLRGDRTAVHALYPVTLTNHEFSLQPAYNGLLFIEHDLLGQKVAERHFMLKVLGSFVAVMCVLTALLGLVLDRAITRPVQLLLHTAQAIANGDRHARAVASGSRELVDLANALNSVTAALVGQQTDLAERELQLRLSHEFSGTGTFEWNLDENMVRGMRHFWMTFFGEKINAPLPYDIGMRSVLPEDRPALDEALNACALIGAALDVHFRCRDRDGLLHWLHLVGNAERDADGCARRIVALTRDETREVVARDSLLATTRELEYQKFALDQHSIVAITDVRGIITYVNEKFCAVSGYARDELLGHSHSLLKSGAHSRAFYQDLWLTIVAGRVWRGELQNCRKDGAHYWVDTTIVPHFDVEGRADGYISIRTDITARVIGEREREHLLQQLYQTQKVEALGLLSGGIAHDFNNLLAAIVGHAELAKRRFGGHGEGKLAVYLHEITSAAERGRDLVQRLLTFSHGSQTPASPLPLAGEIADSLRMLRPLLPSTITITSDLSEDTPLVSISASQAQQIVMNLCINARDAVAGTGRLHIALRFLPREGKCAACGKSFNGWFVSLTVEDSGHGIPPDILDRVFDPFFTTKAVGEGTGLGLSVVHGIVHQAGGHIMVGASASGGTCFEILLAPSGGMHRHDGEHEAAPAQPLRPALEHSV